MCFENCGSRDRAARGLSLSRKLGLTRFALAGTEPGAGRGPELGQSVAVSHPLTARAQKKPIYGPFLFIF